MITTCSIGTDMIDLEVARELQIVVSNQPGRTAPVVAEHMLRLLYAEAKRAAFQTAEIRADRWTRRMNLTVTGKTLGIVGTGNIGAQMARLPLRTGLCQVPSFSMVQTSPSGCQVFRSVDFQTRMPSFVFHHVGWPVVPVR